MKMLTVLGFEFQFCRAENFAAISTRRPNPSSSIQSPTTQQKAAAAAAAANLQHPHNHKPPIAGLDHDGRFTR